MEQDSSLRMRKKRYKLSPVREQNSIKKLIKNLPTDNEVIKITSQGGFSSIGFIAFIAQKTVINDFIVSSLRIGRKHLQYLDALHKQGRLGNATFVVGGLMKDSGKTVSHYKYYEDLEGVCQKNHWNCIVKNNHSKILLFDADDGKYVIETSSNLNENPKMEQFSFEKSDELFFFYKNYLVGT